MIKMLKEYFNKWRKDSIIESDTTLLLMIDEVVNCINYLNDINENYYKSTIDCLTREWYSLSQIAFNRGLSNYKRIK